MQMTESLAYFHIRVEFEKQMIDLHLQVWKNQSNILLLTYRISGILFDGICLADGVCLADDHSNVRMYEIIIMSKFDTKYSPNVITHDEICDMMFFQVMVVFVTRHIIVMVYL